MAKGIEAGRSHNPAQLASTDAPIWHGKASTRDKLILVAVVLGAVAIYVLVAAYVGNWVVTAWVFLITGGFAVAIIRGLWSATWADTWGGLAVLPFVVSGIAYSLYQAICGLFGRSD